MKGNQRRQTHLTETFESDPGQHTSNRFLLDRTLYQGIKDNSLHKIIDLSNEPGRLAEGQLPDEQQELEAILIDMRRRYDEVKSATAQLEIDIDKNRKIVDHLASEEKGLNDHIQRTRKNFEERQGQSDEMTTALEACTYDLDIYREMLERLKKDILVMRKRNFEADLTLKKDGVKVRTLRQDDFNKTRLSYKCRDMLQSVERTVVSKQQERTTKIGSFYDALNRRQQNLVRREER